MMEAYLKHNQNLFYKISNGNCECINTERKSYKNNKFLPSGNMSDVEVITNVEYEQAKKEIGL